MEDRREPGLCVEGQTWMCQGRSQEAEIGNRGVHQERLENDSSRWRKAWANQDLAGRVGIDAAKIPLDLAFGTATWGGFKTHKLQGWEVFEEREPSEGSDPFAIPSPSRSCFSSEHSSALGLILSLLPADQSAARRTATGSCFGNFPHPTRQMLATNICQKDLWFLSASSQCLSCPWLSVGFGHDTLCTSLVYINKHLDTTLRHMMGLLGMSCAGPGVGF